jgi:hypothetical protein
MPHLNPVSLQSDSVAPWAPTEPLSNSYQLPCMPQPNIVDSIRSLPTSPQRRPKVWSPTATSPPRLLQLSISFLWHHVVSCSSVLRTTMLHSHNTSRHTNLIQRYNLPSSFIAELTQIVQLLLAFRYKLLRAYQKMPPVVRYRDNKEKKKHYSEAIPSEHTSVFLRSPSITWPPFPLHRTN